jgi:hypothetical protein
MNQPAGDSFAGQHSAACTSAPPVTSTAPRSDAHACRECIWGNKKKRHCTRRRWLKNPPPLSAQSQLYVSRGECTHFLKCNYPDKANAHMQRCAPRSPPPTPPRAPAFLHWKAWEKRAIHPPTHPPAAARIDHTSCTKCVCLVRLSLSGFFDSRSLLLVYMHTYTLSSVDVELNSLPFVSAAHDLDNDKRCPNDNHLFLYHFTPRYSFWCARGDAGIFSHRVRPWNFGFLGLSIAHREKKTHKRSIILFPPCDIWWTYNCCVILFLPIIM